MLSLNKVPLALIISHHYTLVNLSNVQSIRMNSASRLFYVLFILLFLSSCIEPKTPEEVARHFWTAMQKQDADAAQKLAIDGSAKKLLNLLQPHSFQLEPAETNGNQASIRTTLLKANGTETQEVLLTTVLFYHNERWRVSIKQTESSLLPGALRKLIRSLEEISNSIGHTLGTSSQKSSGQK